MKILFAVHQFFPNHYTGTERLVLNLGKQMQKMGHRVKVVTYAITETEGFTEKHGALFRKYSYQGVPVIAVRHKIANPSLVSFSIFDTSLSGIMDEILSEEQFDILHVCHPMRIGEIIKSAHTKGIPIILTLTDFWLICPRGIAITQNGVLCEGSDDGKNCLKECYSGDFWKNKILERFQQTTELFKYISCVVSATRFMKMMFENRNFYQDIHLIRFGKDFKNIQKNDKKYSRDSVVTIGYLSSLNPHKGAHLLLEAFMQVNPQNVRIKVYGDTSSDPEYFTILKKISKGHPHIEFCGKYAYEEMSQIFEKIDIIAVPSIWWENSPLVLLRAMAHKVPAIVSDLGGLTEIVKDGVNGFTFTVGYTDSLADNSKNISAVIRKISENPEILNDLKANIQTPPRIEEEAFEYEKLFRTHLHKTLD
jgi:glycosyltransferase involved in cell wall biosynthesis